ncbi:MAG: hypothetical protein KAY24_16285 [Candidatus Eisenbacteria sp.]|nr:hypothetical protein [Candidatus Eisenbacteria bacterium]
MSNVSGDTVNRFSGGFSPDGLAGSPEHPTSSVNDKKIAPPAKNNHLRRMAELVKDIDNLQSVISAPFPIAPIL